AAELALCPSRTSGKSRAGGWLLRLPESLRCGDRHIRALRAQGVPWRNAAPRWHCESPDDPERGSPRPAAGPGRARPCRPAPPGQPPRRQAPERELRRQTDTPLCSSYPFPPGRAFGSMSRPGASRLDATARRERILAANPRSWPELRGGRPLGRASETLRLDPFARAIRASRTASMHEGWASDPMPFRHAPAARGLEAGRVLRGCQQPADLFVSHFREFFVEQADGPEFLRRQETDHLVRPVPDLLPGGEGSHAS